MYNAGHFLYTRPFNPHNNFPLFYWEKELKLRVVKQLAQDYTISKEKKLVWNLDLQTLWSLFYTNGSQMFVQVVLESLWKFSNNKFSGFTLWHDLTNLSWDLKILLYIFVSILFSTSISACISIN